MSRLLPAPLMSLCVFVVWLLMVRSVEAGHLVLAAALAWLLPQIGQRLREGNAGLRRPLRALRLFAVVLYDIVVSNIEVAKLILGSASKIQPGFIWVPLEIRSQHAITTLAGIITMTPGTLSTELSSDRRYLLVHCLNLEDEAGTIAQIKQRYEAPLKEIFE